MFKCLSACLIYLLPMTSLMGKSEESQGKETIKLFLQFSYFHALILLWLFKQCINKVFKYYINLIV